jgi:hypothetical protein
VIEGIRDDEIDVPLGESNQVNLHEALWLEPVPRRGPAGPGGYPRVLRVVLLRRQVGGRRNVAVDLAHLGGTAR